MPRKTLARRNSSPNVSSEGWTKAHHEAYSCPPPIETPIPSSVPSNLCSNKQIAPRRRISFDFLRHEGFTIGDKLRRMSFETICNLDVPIYPNLIREFYGTLARGSGGFTCTVRGVSMTITHLLLDRILHLVTEGVEAIVHSKREKTLRFI